MKTLGSLLLLAVVLTCDSRAQAQAPPDRAAGALNDAAISPEHRARQALDQAAESDRLARQTNSPTARRARWEAAARLLEEVNSQSPGHGLFETVALQAIVYRWAIARVWLEQAQTAPIDPEPRQQAIRAIDEVIQHLELLFASRSKQADPLSQNIRFRLAQSLADRASIPGQAKPSAKADRERAAGLLVVNLVQPNLQGAVESLRASLLIELGEFQNAAIALEKSRTSASPPSASDWLESYVKILIGLAQFDAADQILLERGARTQGGRALGLLVLLGRCAQAKGEAERHGFEHKLFEMVSSWPKDADDQSWARIQLARALNEPAASEPWNSWTMLAESKLLLGETEAACSLYREAARRAGAAGQPVDAATSAYRAAALALRAGRLNDSVSWLESILNDPASGSIRPRASLLRVVALGKLSEQAEDPTAEQNYQAALRTHVEQFPEDPTSAEARWLLGEIASANGRIDEALHTWALIPVEAARWSAARRSMARVQVDRLDDLMRRGNREASTAAVKELDQFFQKSLESASSSSDRTDLELLQARANLHPLVRRPEAARVTCERVLVSSGHQGQLLSARWLRLIALVQLNRFIEAANALEAEGFDFPTQILFDLAEALDRAAESDETGVSTRRIGQMMRSITDRIKGARASLSEARRSEQFLLGARALLHLGRFRDGRNELLASRIKAEGLSERTLERLTSTYLRADLPEQAAEASRQRLRIVKEGTSEWFDARLDLAEALIQAGRGNDARRILDTTSALHSDLGGGGLLERFIRLKQRLGS